ncbi:MAG: high-potential iron-sulfur protein, partial [Candidatus Rokuibacteriota bacterium]
VKPSEAQQKAAKKLVKYQETPKEGKTCDRCLQFVPPDACKLVAGKINPKGWCQLFAPKPK